MEHFHCIGRLSLASGLIAATFLSWGQDIPTTHTEPASVSVGDYMTTPTSESIPGVTSWNNSGSTASLEADNTARNVRDRDMRTSTPLDQGNGSSDVEITRTIRKEIMSADNMSVNAQNVKVITNGGKVVLRGPVNSSDEKDRLRRIADRIAGSSNVDDQTEVK